MKEKRKKLKKFSHPISFLMDDKLHISLRIITKDMEISISDFVRESIKEKLSNEISKDIHIFDKEQTKKEI